MARDIYGRPIRTAKSKSEGLPIEIAEGIASGVIGIGQGVAELGTSAVDLIAGSNYSSAVTRSMEDLRDSLGIDPVGFAGKGAEVLTQFVVPGVGVAKYVGTAARNARIAKGIKEAPKGAERFGEIAKQIAAGAGADAVVSTDGMTTIGDFFEGGPTATDQTIGLEGRAEAFRRLKNKLKIGAEAAVVGGAVTGVLEGAGKAIKVSDVGKKLDDLEQSRLYSPEELTPAQTVFADLLSTFKYRGFLPNTIATKRLLTSSLVDGDIKKADAILKKLEKNLDKTLVNVSKNELASERTVLLNKVNDYLTAPKDNKAKLKQQLPKAIHGEVDQMRAHVDDLSKSVLNSFFLRRNDKLIQSDIRPIIEDNLGRYFRRRYRIFEDAKFVPDQDDIARADTWLKSKEGKSYTAKILTKLRNVDSKNFDLNLDKYNLEVVPSPKKDGTTSEVVAFKKGVVPDVAASAAREQILKTYRKRFTAGRAGGRIATDKLQPGMFIERENLPRTIRKLMGEIDDPRDAYIGTVADLSQFKAIDDYYGTVKELAENSPNGIGKMFVNPQRLVNDLDSAGKPIVDPTTGIPRVRLERSKAEIQEMLDSGNWKQLGSADAPSPTSVDKQEMAQLLKDSTWGELHGYLVPTPVYNNLTSVVLGDDDILKQIMSKTLGAFLKLKGASQYSKTVLSPVTQIRNFTTASLFAVANGNIGSGMGGSLASSMDMVYQNIMGKYKNPELLAGYLENANRRGVLGTQAELREIQDMIGKGQFSSSGKLSDAQGRIVQSGAEALLKGVPDPLKFANTRLAQGGGKAFKFMEKAYQGSDDVWKLYNYEFETNKLRNALRGLTDEQKFLYLTKNGEDMSSETYQNWARAGGRIEKDAAGKLRITNLKSIEQVVDDADPVFKFKRDIGMEKNYNVIDELMLDRAAQIVRDTVPNYNMAPQALRLARQLPVGNFITFPYEIWRTSTNIIRQSLDEMTSGIDEVKKIGQRRLAGLTSAMVIIPGALATTAYSLTNVSRDEMKAYQRSFGATWEKNALLIPLSKAKDGTLTYVNFSLSNPYDTISRMGYAAMNAVETGAVSNESVPDIMGDIVFQSIKEFAEPFADQSMVADAMLDITIRGGKSSTGAEIYNPQDTVINKGSKSMLHIMDTILPNIIPLEVSGGELQLSRFARAGLGEFGVVSPQDKFGRQRSVFGTREKFLADGELFRLTGFSTREFDIKKGTQFKGREHQRAQRDSRRLFNRYTDDANANANTFVEGYQYANERKFVNDKKFYQAIKDLKTLGLSEPEIKKILKQNAMLTGDVKEIFNGKFTPFNVTDDNIRKMKQAGTYNIFPTPIINEMSNTFKNLSYEDVSPAPTRTQSSGVAGALSSLVENIQNIVPPAAAATTTPGVRPQFTTPQSNIDPQSLAGSNLATQEIARRQSPS